MAAFFRIGALEGSGEPGHMLIHQVIDAGGNTLSGSRLSGRGLELHDDVAERFARSRLPPVVRDVLFRQYKSAMRRHADETGIVVDRQAPFCADDRLAIDWAGFAMESTDDGLRIRLPLSAGQALEVALRPAAPWMRVDGSSLDRFYGGVFDYVSCPRMEASGGDGRRVSGTLWFDHQWGRYEGWLLRRVVGWLPGYGSGRLEALRWNWFGISLDDGRHFIFQRHWPERGNVLLASFVVLFEGESVRPLEGGFSAEPLRRWHSDRSGAEYPIDWRLTLPAMDLVLDIRALIDDQEIPVYGIGGVWEGEVIVSGHQGDRVVSGRGRLELMGYAMLTVARRELLRQFRALLLGVRGQ